MPTSVTTSDKQDHQNNMTGKPHPKKKMVRMSSVDKNMVCSTKFQVSKEEPLPEVPESGVRLKVCFAGACSPDIQRTRTTIRNKGLLDTSLFPGYEISGIVDEIGPLAKTDLVSGDRVIVYQDEDIGFDDGYTEFITIKNPSNIIPVPKELSLEVAALLPCGGLTAYSACMRAKPYIEDSEKRRGKCNILVVGAGGLGLWTTIMAAHLSGPEGTCDLKVHVIVADTNSEKLTVAQKYGCYGVIHWPMDAYEEHILERTRDACPDGFDLIIDFVSSPRTIARGLKVLNTRGALVVGGNSQHIVQFDLANLAKNEQTVIGVRKGTKEELLKLVDLVSSGMISTPQFNTFRLEQADDAFQGLSDCKLNGRAVIQVSPFSV